jgi:hypothetical protein
MGKAQEMFDAWYYGRTFSPVYLLDEAETR